MQQSVVAIPDDDAFTDVLERLRELLADVGGQVTLLHTEAVAGGGEGRLLQARNAPCQQQPR